MNLCFFVLLKIHQQSSISNTETSLFWSRLGAIFHTKSTFKKDCHKAFHFCHGF